MLCGHNSVPLGVQGRPPRGKDPLLTHQESLDCYAKYCTSEQKERIADFVTLMYYKVCHYQVSLCRLHPVSEYTECSECSAAY